MYHFQAIPSFIYVPCDLAESCFWDAILSQMLILADHYPALKRGLWWLLASSVVRHHHGFRMMDLAGVYQVGGRSLESLLW